MVPTARLELARLSPPPPQDGVSTSSTTSALKILLTILLVSLSKIDQFGISSAFDPDPSPSEGSDSSDDAAGAVIVAPDITPTDRVSSN